MVYKSNLRQRHGGRGTAEKQGANVQTAVAHSLAALPHVGADPVRITNQFDEHSKALLVQAGVEEVGDLEEGCVAHTSSGRTNAPARSHRGQAFCRSACPRTRLSVPIVPPSAVSAASARSLSSCHPRSAIPRIFFGGRFAVRRETPLWGLDWEEQIARSLSFHCGLPIRVTDASAIQ
jgi:hypothetical protein